MGKFVVGLIIGMIVGVAAMTVNPNLPHDLRVALASLTAQVMRTAEETAEDLGDAAEGVADEAGRPVESGAPVVTKEIPDDAKVETSKPQ